VDDHDLSRFCCLNPDCPDHAQRGHGNLSVIARYGPRRTRMLRCSTCQSRFSERKGTPLFGTRHSPATVLDILAHVAEGVGTRKTSGLVGVHRDTVTQ
jgi:transposase-like protein